MQNSGKSYYIKHNLLKKYQNKIIFDFEDEYSSYGIKVTSPYEAINLLHTKTLAQVNYSIVLAFNHVSDYYIFLQGLDNYRDFTVVLDESYRLMATNRENEIMLNFYAAGRHRNICLIAASQRPAQISKLVTSQSNKIIFFRLHEPNDLKYVRSLAGKDFMKTVASLGRTKHIIYPPKELAF